MGKEIIDGLAVDKFQIKFSGTMDTEFNQQIVADNEMTHLTFTRVQVPSFKKDKNGTVTRIDHLEVEESIILSGAKLEKILAIVYDNKEQPDVSSFEEIEDEVILPERFEVVEESFDPVSSGVETLGNVYGDPKTEVTSSPSVDRSTGEMQTVENIGSIYGNGKRDPVLDNFMKEEA